MRRPILLVIGVLIAILAASFFAAYVQAPSPVEETVSSASSSSMGYAENIGMETADAMYDGNVYVNGTYGFAVNLPKEWKRFGVYEEKTDEDVTLVNIGLPMVAPEAKGKIFSLWTVWVMTPAQFVSMEAACDGAEYICFVPEKLGEANGYVFGAGQYYMAGGYEPCAEEAIASGEKEFCAMHELITQYPRSWSFKVL